MMFQADLASLPTIKDWRLNERHYGALTGLNKAGCVETWGADQVGGSTWWRHVLQVAVWRRSFAVPPPPMEDNHPCYHQVGQGKITSDDIFPDLRRSLGVRSSSRSAAKD